MFESFLLAALPLFARLHPRVVVMFAEAPVLRIMPTARLTLLDDCRLYWHSRALLSPDATCVALGDIRAEALHSARPVTGSSELSCVSTMDDSPAPLQMSPVTLAYLLSLLLFLIPWNVFTKLTISVHVLEL